MTRNELICHLIDEGCYPDELGDNEYSQPWINSVNGEICYVPYEDELVLSTYCHIFYELKIDPPLKYDADYHVYVSFLHSPERQRQLKSEED